MNKVLSMTVGLMMAALFAAESYAAPVLYQNKGKENTAKYSFVAEEAGDLKVYFAGKGGKYECEIGVLINGENTGLYGLNSRDSSVGDLMDFGDVEEGDVITFMMVNRSLGNLKVYSNPSKNKKYDATKKGMNHIYSRDYIVDKGFNSEIPNGTYVGFEDKRFKNKPDWDYNDFQIVYNVTSVTPGPTPVPEPSAALIGVLAPMLFGSRLMRRRRTA